MAIILYDWCSFTSKIDSVESIISILGLEGIKFTETFGARGYKSRLYFDGISIHYEGYNEGIWVEMSGQGCRAFEEYGTGTWELIFNTIRSDTESYNITRLDVAFDDKEDIIDIYKIYDETNKLNFTSKFQSIKVERDVKKDGITIYYGSPSSRIMLRLYDKAKERKAKGKDFDGHWVRFEIQLRDERAMDWINRIDTIDIGILFAGVINNYIRYIIPADVNKSRCPTAPYWEKIIKTSEKIGLYTPCDTEYNLEKLKMYVYTQPANAIDTIIQIQGKEKFLEELQKYKPVRNRKYQEILNNHKAEVIDAIAKDWSLEPGAWSLEPGAQTWSLELRPGAWSLEPGAQSLEPGAQTWSNGI